jgi:hypothetical protein
MHDYQCMLLAHFSILFQLTNMVADNCDSNCIQDTPVMNTRIKAVIFDMGGVLLPSPMVLWKGINSIRCSFVVFFDHH